MSRLILNEQASTPATPASTKVALFVDNTAIPRFKMVDDLGNVTFQLDSQSLTGKGALISASAANTPVTITAGANGKILAANSAAASGLAYVDAVPIQSSVSTPGAGFASDTYLAGSCVTIPTAGAWTAQAQYHCMFDMTKTAFGTSAFTITVRMGTLGTTGDAAILALAYAVGTAAIDAGTFEVFVTFRTVGSGTSAVIQGVTRCLHHLAATGLVTTGAAGNAVIVGTSSGFNSTTQTKIGLSINGGTSFAGTCTMVQARCFGVNI